MRWLAAITGCQKKCPSKASDNRLFDGDAVESLEDRQLLPRGDVAVVIAPSGDVRITGDAADNQFEFVRDGNDGLYVLGNNGTTVNGQLTFGLGTSTIERRLIINTRGGDDHVVVNDLRIEDDLKINTGAGDDLIVVGESSHERIRR